MNSNYLGCTHARLTTFCLHTHSHDSTPQTHKKKVLRPGAAGLPPGLRAHDAGSRAPRRRRWRWTRTSRSTSWSSARARANSASSCSRPWRRCKRSVAARPVCFLSAAAHPVVPCPVSCDRIAHAPPTHPPTTRTPPSDHSCWTSPSRASCTS